MLIPTPPIESITVISEVCGNTHVPIPATEKAAGALFRLAGYLHPPARLARCTSAPARRRDNSGPGLATRTGEAARMTDFPNSTNQTGELKDLEARLSMVMAAVGVVVAQTLVELDAHDEG